MDETYRNELGQPVGKPLPGWKAAKPLLAPVLEGRHCRLEPLSAAHAPDLFDAYALDADGRNWTYLPYGPFGTLQTYETWLAGVIGKPDPAFMAVISLETRKPVGVGSFMRMDPPNGTIEIGHLNFSPLMQRSIVSSEALILMIRHCFSLGNRRVEWKCDAANAASMRAAERYGFRFEGIFRNHLVYKKRNRDTAWFAIIDDEWPALDAIFSNWLDACEMGHPVSLSESVEALRQTRTAT